METKARESIEHFEGAHQRAELDGVPAHLIRNAAIVVAVFAAFLAIAAFLAETAMKDVVTGETKAADASARLEANSVKTTIAENDATLFRVIGGDRGERAAAERAIELERRLVAHYAPIDEELAHEVAAERSARDSAEKRHKLYEIASVALQIAIVVASISIIARSLWLLRGGVVLGVAGVGILVVGLVV